MERARRHMAGGHERTVVAHVASRASRGYGWNGHKKPGAEGVRRDGHALSRLHPSAPAPTRYGTDTSVTSNSSVALRGMVLRSGELLPYASSGGITSRRVPPTRMPGMP